MNNLLNNSSEYDSSGAKNVEARYMSKGKKKYQLAGIDTNVEKLKEDQIQELTKILIGMKSEYDELIRDTLKNKKETDVIAKQIEMLEKIEKKKNDKLADAEAHLAEIKRQIEIKQMKLEEETYQRDTMNHLLERMKEENLSLQKKINVNEIDFKRNRKELIKQKLKTTEIKEKMNQLQLKTESILNKNQLEKNEHSQITQYYNAVIENRWNFIKSSDERKEKQKRIAQEAKNDTQDKQEVEKRKQYFLLRLFNRYLKRKIEKERKDNEKLEETFQNIKKITGMSNVKNIVEKIGNKDKDYNHCVAKVNDKEIKITILREQIKKLNQDFIMLKNEATVDISESYKIEQKEMKYDEEEQELIKREQELMEELEEFNNKNTNVELTFEKVVENIKLLIGKSEHLQKILDPNYETSKNEKNVNTEDDVFNSYLMLMDLMREVVDKFIKTMSVEDFIDMMKERGYEMVNKLEKKSQSVISNNTKHANQNLNKKLKHKDDDLIEDADDDEGEVQINEEFKDVIRGVIFVLIKQQRAAAERLKQEKLEKEVEKKK